jgi:hypothetical protein
MTFAILILGRVKNAHVNKMPMLIFQITFKKDFKIWSFALLSK